MGYHRGSTTAWGLPNPGFWAKFTSNETKPPHQNAHGATKLSCSGGNRRCVLIYDRKINVDKRVSDEIKDPGVNARFSRYKMMCPSPILTCTLYRLKQNCVRVCKSYPSLTEGGAVLFCRAPRPRTTALIYRCKRWKEIYNLLKNISKAEINIQKLWVNSNPTIILHDCSGVEIQPWLSESF